LVARFSGAWTPYDIASRARGGCGGGYVDDELSALFDIRRRLGVAEQTARRVAAAAAGHAR
jgi:hypothetical protein